MVHWFFVFFHKTLAWCHSIHHKHDVVTSSMCKNLLSLSLLMPPWLWRCHLVHSSLVQWASPYNFEFVGSVHRTMTMHLCFKSKFPDHFAFTLGRYLFLLFLYIWSNVDVNYSHVNLLNYSCSLKYIDKNLVNHR